MATITQADFNARMDSWWNARMSPNAADNAPRRALRAAPWQQQVGRTGKSTHDTLFGTMQTLLQEAAADNDPAECAEQLAGALDYQQLAELIVAAMADPQRSNEEIAATLKAALGDRANEVCRLLSA